MEDLLLCVKCFVYVLSPKRFEAPAALRFIVFTTKTCSFQTALEILIEISLVEAVQEVEKRLGSKIVKNWKFFSALQVSSDFI